MAKTAIITGGAGGMGLATARLLGADHRIVLADLDQERLDTAAAILADNGIEAGTFVCDITDRDSVGGLFRDAAGGGTVRAVVHTAGVSPQMGDAAKMIRINALGTVNLTKAALGAAGEGFALVNVASIAGHLIPRAIQPRRSYRLALTDPERFTAKLTTVAHRAPQRLRSGLAYGISKHFVIWFSQEMAESFGAKGARILSVSPGSFDTAMGRLEEASGSGRLVDHAALQRYGRPEEVAEVLAFCASERPGYLTGTDILCDGGVNAGLGRKDRLAMASGR
ncbi:SDR family oxidoreductase [Glycomyces sp. NPDC021274]|uniref:SDR family NAD(P)-dependent oxidoreductase n=1 Tax=Glycomyces sp. NPDC021274 TaxID=3155120 RepID=UPI0033EAAAAE